MMNENSALRNYITPYSVEMRLCYTGRGLRKEKSTGEWKRWHGMSWINFSEVVHLTWHVKLLHLIQSRFTTSISVNNCSILWPFTCTWIWRLGAVTRTQLNHYNLTNLLNLILIMGLCNATSLKFNHSNTRNLNVHRIMKIHSYILNNSYFSKLLLPSLPPPRNKWNATALRDIILFWVLSVRNMKKKKR
jgi:hypothetical protein